jgi:hypothetical protein
MNSNTTILNLLKTNGFTQVPNKDWPNTVGDKLKDAVDSVWGLQMRANKWADVFVISLDDGDWKIINDDQIKNIGANTIEKELIALMNEGFVTEKLSASQPASEWIQDFVHSKNPMFKDKTKKERISMALGAYYAAQKNEEYGAGFEGTTALRDKYIKDTPGQRIQQFKTTMKDSKEKLETEIEEAQGKTVESVYDDLSKMSGSALRGILRRIDHPDYNIIKDQGREDIIAEILMSKFGEEEALEFLENPDNFKMSKYAIQEAINIRDYMATSEKSQFGGYRPKVVHKDGTVLYLDQTSYNTPDEAKDHAEEYLKQYARGISEPRVPSKGTYGDYNATSEKSQFGGYRPKVVRKDGKTLYLSAASYNTPDEAKDHAEEYLKQYARGISEPRVPSKGTYGLKEEKESYDSWIIKPRDGGESVTIKAPDETSAIEIALGRKPSQHELDFFNFHYILIQEKTNVSTLRHMKIVELATNCHDEKTLKEYVEQQYKSGSSVIAIKESFKKFVSNK